MNNPIKKIALILILVILLPAMFFTLYEINSLNESEQVIEEIYSNQLEAILFSVNQYSEDVASNWRSKLNLILTESVSAQDGQISYSDQFKTKADSLLNINNSIISIYLADSLDVKNFSAISSDSPFDIKNFLGNNSEKIKRLYTYERGGYSKIEPLENESTDSSTALLFLLDDPLELKNICIMIVDPVKFVRDVLGTKIKEISEDKFIITCSSRLSGKTNDFIFFTEELRDQEVQQKKNLWLIPNYELGILLKGKTIESLVKERSTTGLILVLLLVVILVSGVIIVFRNIRKEIELARIKSDFVSNVSHELRTPLALISMFAETLEMGRTKTEEKKNEYYSIISKEAGRLSKIVNKILSFSKIEAGKREYRFSNVNINKLTEDIFNSYQFHLQNNNFKFSFKPDESISEIKADGEAISEAIINLLDNAIKYSTDKKDINITTGSEKNYVYVEVNDKGIGIKEENQKKIFDKFYRVTDGLVHNTKGTGLGLTLVKHILDAHRGEIKVKSKPSEGSTFRLSFPTDNLKGNK